MTSLKHQKVKIRKPHRCFCCLRVFPKGDMMISWTGIYEGDFNHGYNCLTCEEIMKLDKDNYEGFEEGFVANELSKGQSPEDLLNHLRI